MLKLSTLEKFWKDYGLFDIATYEAADVGNEGIKKNFQALLEVTAKESNSKVQKLKDNVLFLRKDLKSLRYKGIREALCSYEFEGDMEKVHKKLTCSRFDLEDKERWGAGGSEDESGGSGSEDE